jgi:hypothetical protein
MITADSDPHGLDEERFTSLVTEHAKKLYPADRADVAFSKVYSAGTEDAEFLRLAHKVVTGTATIMPTQIGGKDVNVNTPQAALQQLNDLAEPQRRRAQGVRSPKPLRRYMPTRPIVNL